MPYQGKIHAVESRGSGGYRLEKGGADLTDPAFAGNGFVLFQEEEKHGAHDNEDQ